MPDIDQRGPANRRQHAAPMASPFLEFDLTTEVDRLHREATWRTGHNARTLVKYDDLRVVLTTLRAGMRLPAHQTDGRLSLQLLSGHARLSAAGRTFDLRAGSFVALDHGTPHDLEALEESAFVLTIAWPGRAALSPRTGADDTPVSPRESRERPDRP